MNVPSGYDTMSDEELLEALKKFYDPDAAQYVLDVLRGRTGDDIPIH